MGGATPPEDGAAAQTDADATDSAMDASVTPDTPSVDVPSPCAGVVCDDDNECTEDECVGGECVFSPLEGETCLGGEQCATAGVCQADGSCLGAVALNCDDSNPCTTDSCDPKTAQCTHVPIPNGQPCGDGNACTQGDSCVEGVCMAGDAADCDDENGCTSDDCDSVTGECVYGDIADNEACEDGDPCTAKDSCNQGSCAGGVAVDCDDDNVCTDDSCDAQVGCQNDPNDLPCSDESVCTVGDQCTDGSCIGEDLVCNDNNAH